MNYPVLKLKTAGAWFLFVSILTVVASFEASAQRVRISGNYQLCQGGPNPVFTADATSLGTSPTYIWYKNGNDITTGVFGLDNLLSGNQYQSKSGLNNGDRIVCRITYNSVVYSSNEIVISVSTGVAPTPALTINADKYTLCDGDEVTFTATSNWTITNYQWKKDPYTGNAAAFTVRIASNYTEQPVQVTSSLQYTTACGTQTTVLTSSTLAQPLAVSPVVSAGVSVTGPSAVCAGAGITYQAHPANGGSAPSYIWKVNGSAVQTGANDSYTTSSLNQGDVVVVQMHSSVASCLQNNDVESTGIVVSVTPVTTMGISIQGKETLCPGENPVYKAYTTNGGTSPTYIWYKNGLDITTGMNGLDNLLSGNQYQSKNGLGNGDKIMCKVLSSSSCVFENPAFSNEIVIAITPSATPILTIHADKKIFCEGDNVTFSANSSLPITSYRWQGVNDPATGYDPTYSASNISISNTTSFLQLTATLQDVCTAYEVTTKTLDQPLIVYPALNKAIAPSGSGEICSTCTQQISASAGEEYTYQWKKDDQDILGANDQTYVAGDPGRYYAIISRIGCTSRNSLAFTLSKNKAPYVNVGTDQTLTAPVYSLTLKGDALDPDGVIASLAWKQQSGPFVSLAGTTATDLVLPGLAVGSYVFRLTATDDFGESAYDDITVAVNPPPDNYNLIHETTPLVGKSDESQLQDLIAEQKSFSTTYFDGLGRPMQKVIWQGSPQKQDVVQPIIYDAFGRESVKYLPYTSTETNGFYKQNPVGTPGNYTGSDQYKFYNQNNNAIARDLPKSITVFESGPLDRALKQGAPGAAWQPNDDPGLDKTVKHSYEVNSENEVILFSYDASTGLVTAGSSSVSYYEAKQLHANKDIDEDNNEVITYIDKEGRTVCKKVQYGTDTATAARLYASTYYIYDDFGDLVYVIPPEGVNAVLSSVVTSD